MSCKAHSDLYSAQSEVSYITCNTVKDTDPTFFHNSDSYRVQIYYSLPHPHIFIVLF